MCFTGYRWAAGDYLPGGQFARAGVSSAAFFGKRVVPLKLLVFVSMLHGCYQVHFDAPRVFSAVAYLPCALERFKRVAWSSFIVAGMINACILTATFLTFGATAKSVVLNCYAENDWGAFLGRLAVLISLMSSYPLMFNGFASNMLNLATFFATPRDDAGGAGPAPTIDEYTRQGVKDALAMVLVSFNMCMGLSIEDLGFLCAFAGSVISGVIIFVFPPIFHMRVLSLRAARCRERGGGSAAWAPQERALWWGSAAIGALGVALCLAGAAVNFEVL
jgi:amino acid permease